MRRYRRNADERIRRLERAAAGGDPDARLRLDVESVKLSAFPLYLPTKRIKAVVKAMLSPQEIRRLARGHDLRDRYTWQDLVAYLQEDPSTELVLPRLRRGSKVYSWEHDHYRRGIPSGWQRAVVIEIKKPEVKGGDRVVMLRFPGSPDPSHLVPRSLSSLSKTPLEGELVKPPKVRRREQFKPGYDPGASFAALWLDGTRVGTPLYGGLAYFWAHEYRYPMREIPDLARKAVHDTWLKHGLVLHGESPEHERLMRAVLRTPEGWHWEGEDLVRAEGEYGAPSWRVRTRPGHRWRPPSPLPNPRVRRNADLRFREIERRFQSGDPEAWGPYVRALRQRGDWLAARDLVLQRMIASSEWAPWPANWDDYLSSQVPPGSASAAFEMNERNFRLAAIMDHPIVAPMLLVEVTNDDGDIETLAFEDGPYVVDIDGYDDEYVNRRIDDEPPGPYIPLWRVNAVYPPPFGIPQKGYEFLREGYASSMQPTIDVSYGPTVHVDGVSIADRGDGWAMEADGHLVSPAARRYL
jgi:hypothetical protein